MSIAPVSMLWLCNRNLVGKQNLQMSKGRRSQGRKPGHAAFGDPEQAQKAIQKAAVRLVEKEGLSELTFARVAKAVGMTRTAPIHHFGSTAGLVASVAVHFFEKLDHELVSASAGLAQAGARLRAIVLAYARFSLKHPELYRAAHSALLWKTGFEATADSIPSRYEADWVGRAYDTRGEVFDRFVSAATDWQAGGPARGRAADQVAHTFTILVDGMMFQVTEEQVFSDMTEEERIDWISDLVDFVMAGFESMGSRARYDDAERSQ